MQKVKKSRSHKNRGELPGRDVLFSKHTVELDFGSLKVDLAKAKVEAIELEMKRQADLAPMHTPDFENLNTSTSTVMCYANIDFDTKKIFNQIEWTEVEIPHTKKRNNVDKKNIKAPKGAIVSVQSKTELRGSDIRKRKKHWCTVCQPVKIQDNNREVKVNTVTEYLEPKKQPIQEDYSVDGTMDVQSIMYFCHKCQRSFFPEELKKINHFLNQITIVISVGDPPLLNTMLFKDALKFAGCKNMEDAIEAMSILWTRYISKIPGAWKLKPGHSVPTFTFETVMRNVDFKIGFPIERNALNEVMNSPAYADVIHMSQYEPTLHTNVNIQMYSKKPDPFYYTCLEIPFRGKSKRYQTTELKYKKIKPPKKFVTFIVFSSSETILSGRYHGNMKEMYEHFLRIVGENREKITERIDLPNQKEIAKIKTKVGYLPVHRKQQT